jgi:hypothetical protein
VPQAITFYGPRPLLDCVFRLRTAQDAPTSADAGIMRRCGDHLGARLMLRRREILKRKRPLAITLQHMDMGNSAVAQALECTCTYLQSTLISTTVSCTAVTGMYGCLVQARHSATRTKVMQSNYSRSRKNMTLAFKYSRQGNLTSLLK